MPWNCLYTLKNALNAGFEWPKFKAFSSSIRQTRVLTRGKKGVNSADCIPDVFWNGGPFLFFECSAC